MKTLRPVVTRPTANRMVCSCTRQSSVAWWISPGKCSYQRGLFYLYYYGYDVDSIIISESDFHLLSGVSYLPSG